VEVVVPEVVKGRQKVVLEALSSGREIWTGEAERGEIAGGLVEENIWSREDWAG